MDFIELIRKNPKKAIAFIIIISFIFVSIISFKGIKYKFEEENLLPNNKVVKANEEVLKEYENYYFVPVLIKSLDGNILNKENLLEILKIEKNINESLNAKSFSIADIIADAFLISKNKSINYENKIEEIKERSNEDIKNLLQIILKFTPKDYISIFLSKDFNGTKAKATFIEFSLNGSLIFNDKRAFEEEKKIRSLLKGKYIEATSLGGQLITNEIMKENRKSISLLLPISFALVVIVLIFIYRSIFELFTSFLILGLSIIWVYGFGAVLGYQLNPISTAIPVLLVGIGIDYSIHLILRIKEGKNEKIVISALLLSTLTTAIGFLSNTISSIPLLKQFGILSSFGILSCFIITIFLVPAFDEIKKFKRIKERKIITNVFSSVIEKTNKHSFFSIIIISLITTIMFLSSLNLKATYDIKDFLPKNLKISRDARYLIKNFNFSGEVDILIKGNVSSPHLLMKIKNSIDEMKDDKYIIKIGKKPDIESILSLMHDYATNDSFLDLRYNKTFAEMYNKYMENDLPKKNTTSRDIIKLFDWIYCHGGKYVLHKKNGHYDGCVLRIRVSTHGKKEIIKKVYNEIREDIKNEDWLITGSVITGYIVMESLQKSQIDSIILAIIFSFFVMEIIFIRKYKSYVLSFISLLPVILSSIWILGTMELLGKNLTITTITVASISIGLGIDYSIHMTNEFMYYRKPCNAVRNIGYALLASVLTTILAFFLLSFSFLPPLKTFGILISISILYAFISCLFILPIFLGIWNKFTKFR